MNRNYLSGLFFPAVAGLFFFMKRPESEEAQIVSPSYSGDSSGLTGVAKYLEKQQEILLAHKTSEPMESQEIGVLISGVSRYLENRDRFPVTGVTKYTRRLALVEKQSKSSEFQVGVVTGVAKYIKNQKDVPVLSGVAKYLKQQEGLPKASKVAKYMARQAFAEKQAKQMLVHVDETGVAKYLKQKDSLPQMSRVAKYVARQELLTKKEKQLIINVELTGVAKYLKIQESMPQVSRVSKYMARQALALRQKPVIIETGVEKYMRHQG